MEINEDYLDKMLNFAIKYHNNKPSELNKIPLKFDNLNSALENFQSALEYETYSSLNEETGSIKDPTLYTVNLNSNEPGIILGKKTDNNILVHVKSNSDYNLNKKRKKIKTEKEIEDQANKVLEKLDKKDKEIEKKFEIRDTKKKISEEKKEIKKKDKEISKMESEEKKYSKEIEKLEKQNKIENEEIIKNKYEMINNLKKEIEKIQKYTEDKKNQMNEKKQIIDEYNKEQEEKKIARQKKREENKKKKEEKMKELLEKNEADNIDNCVDSVTEENEIINQNIKKPSKKLENKPIIECDEEDILEEFYKSNNLEKYNHTENKELEYNEVVLHPSPIPLERHIYALTKSDPNPIFLPLLLYGKKLNTNREYLKIYHGPPGTGKTYTLIKELESILPKLTGNILICAPSNIGVLNLYNRAKSMGIQGRLIISSDMAKLLKDDIIEESKINKKVYFSTISMRSGRQLDNIIFNTIMVDEVAQCPESSIWGLLRKSVTKLYLAGDHKQLPCLVSNEGEKLEYGRSIMQRLMELDINMKLLDVQRRMHPEIVKFSNQMYYNNQLKTEYSGEYNVEPLEIIDIDSEEEKVGNSFSNHKEAIKIIDLFNEYKNIFKDIVVISPYKAQCELLKKMNQELKIHTLDSFQGREADMIILCTVRTSSLGFWNDERRLNVGLTRAKHVLRVIGNTSNWKNGPLKDFLYFYKNK